MGMETRAGVAGRVRCVVIAGGAEAETRAGVVGWVRCVVTAGEAEAETRAGVVGGVRCVVGAENYRGRPVDSNRASAGWTAALKKKANISQDPREIEYASPGAHLFCSRS